MASRHPSTKQQRREEGGEIEGEGMERVEGRSQRMQGESQKQGGFQSPLPLFSPPWWPPSPAPHLRSGSGCTWHREGVRGGTGEE